MKFPLPASDPLGTDIKIDDSGDIVLSWSGSLQTVSQADNVAQEIRMKFMTNQESYHWGEKVGHDLSSYVDKPMTAALETEIRNIATQIMTTDKRVLKVISVDIDDSQQPDTLILTAEALVQGVGTVRIPVVIGGKIV